MYTQEQLQYATQYELDNFGIQEINKVLANSPFLNDNSPLSYTTYNSQLNEVLSECSSDRLLALTDVDIAVLHELDSSKRNRVSKDLLTTVNIFFKRMPHCAIVTDADFIKLYKRTRTVYDTTSIAPNQFKKYWEANPCIQYINRLKGYSFEEFDLLHQYISQKELI